MNGNGLEIVCAPEMPPWQAEFMLHGRLPRVRYDLIPALSCSLMKQWLKDEATPSKFKWWLVNRWNRPPTAPLAMGLALDHMLLEPTTFPERFAILPEKGPRGGEGPKLVTAAHREEHPGKVVLTHTQHQAAVAMAKALQESKATKKGAVFQHCKKAVAVAQLFGGVPFKGEFDLWDNGRTYDTCGREKCARRFAGRLRAASGGAWLCFTRPRFTLCWRVRLVSIRRCFPSCVC